MKVVKTNEEDSQGEILFYQQQDQVGEEVRHICLKESPRAAQRAVGNHQRIDRPILKVTPRIDQPINGVSKFQIEQESTGREIIANLTRQVSQSSNKEKLMKELSPQDGQNPHPMSEESKSIIVEQANMEALDSWK